MTIFDGGFNILDTGIGMLGYNSTDYGDIHDFVYIDDDHIILYSGYGKNVQIPNDNTERYVSGQRINELKKVNGQWKLVGQFTLVDYPQLCTDVFGNLGTEDDIIDSHGNTITLDYDGNLILNCRNWDTFMKIRRVDNGDGTYTLGSKTLDYNEAIIGRVGGRHNSAYMDSKRVLNEGFSFTDTPTSLNDMSDDDWEEWQWYHSHDVKYWGMKNINGQNYPTYTIFDNNMWTRKEFISGRYNIINKHNNIDINPVENSGSYTRIVQLSIDWTNHLIKDYRVYYIPGKYSSEQGGATMYDEGIISIAYSYAGEFGFWDFTTGETEVSGHIYKGAKQLFLGKYDTYRICYRANTYKINI